VGRKEGNSRGEEEWEEEGKRGERGEESLPGAVQTTPEKKMVRWGGKKIPGTGKVGAARNFCLMRKNWTGRWETRGRTSGDRYGAGIYLIAEGAQHNRITDGSWGPDYVTAFRVQRGPGRHVGWAIFQLQRPATGPVPARLDEGWSDLVWNP